MGFPQIGVPIKYPQIAISLERVPPIFGNPHIRGPILSDRVTHQRSCAEARPHEPCKRCPQKDRV